METAQTEIWHVDYFATSRKYVVWRWSEQLGFTGDRVKDVYKAFSHEDLAILACESLNNAVSLQQNRLGVF